MSDKARRQGSKEACGTVRTRDGFDSLGLSDEVLRAVDELGYETPTPVQRQAIPAVLAGSDVMAQAQTGTGKTCAFVLPILSVLPKAEGMPARVLVVTPTRELAAQIFEVCGVVGASTGHTTAVVVGGVGYEGQREALRQCPDVVVATPGRLCDLVDEGTCDLSGVEVLVLDEADRMLDMGFLPQVRRIVDRLASRRQTLLFSATLETGAIGGVADLVHDPVRVEVSPTQLAAEGVAQYVLGVSAEAKKRVLVEILSSEDVGRAIVFCRGRHRADHLSRVLVKKGLRSAPIHGGRTQGQRMRSLERFRAGEVDVLVATDVLARGIDVAEVSLVVNCDVPKDPESYVHRIGRTGRSGAEGRAVTFVSSDELDDFLAIERLVGRRIEEFPVPDGIDVGESPARLDPDRMPVRGRGKGAGQGRADVAGKGEDAPRPARRRRRRRKRTTDAGGQA